MADGAYSSSDSWSLPELQRWWNQQWMSAQLTQTSLKSLSMSSLLDDFATLDSQQNLVFKQPQVLIGIITYLFGQLAV